MEYAIVTGVDLSALVKLVDAKVAEGWRPSGGPAQDFDSRQWVQALTRGYPGQFIPGEVKLREPLSTSTDEPIDLAELSTTVGKRKKR